MEQTFEIFGSKIACSSPNSIEELFNEVLIDSDHSIWLSKESYSAYLDEKEVKIRFIIEFECYSDDGEEVKSGYILSAIPEIEYFTPEKLQNIAENEGENVTIMDAYYYGAYITIGSMCKDSGDCDDEIVKGIANYSLVVASMIGWHLDKYQNRIGCTGWDYLTEFCVGGDACQMALDRWKESQSK